MDQRRIVQLVEAQAAAQLRIEDEAVAAADRALTQVRSWGEPAAVARLGLVVGGYARAAAAQSAALVDAYLTRVLTEILGQPVSPGGAIDVTAPLRRGVDAYDKVYWRVATTARVALSEGATPDQALSLARQRAEVIGREDAALARRQQSLKVLSGQPRVKGYRRVVRPYMSTGGSCGLCVAAADRMYYRDQLMPLHARCKCVVVPATTAHDPGGTLNDEDFAEVYALSASNSAADLKRVRIRVEDHGELGPTLVAAA